MRHTGAFFWVLVCAVIAGSTLGIQAAEKVGIRWHEQVLDAWKKAQEDKRPLLVYVVMDGCAYCRKMERDTLSQPQIAEKVERSFVATKLNGPKDPALAKRLKVEVYPTTVIISPDNKVLDMIPGYTKPEDLVARLDQVAQDQEQALASASQNAPAASKMK